MREQKEHIVTYTDEEFNELKEKIGGIKDFIHESLLPYVWDNYKRITGSTENRPCNCGSAANHWIKAVKAIREYISEKETAVGE